MVANEKWFGATADFYNGNPSRSMRFRRNVGSNTEINFDPSSAGNAQKHTISVWVKRSKISDGSQVILGAFQSSYSDFLYFRSDDRLEYSVGNAHSVAADMRFRDVTNWYHIVTHFDVANSTTTDRLKFWVNGVEQTKTITYSSYPANNNFGFSTTNDHTIGGLTHFGGYELEGYLYDFNFVDGSLVDYTTFAETKNGVWIPKKFDASTITYGTNGFRMLFTGESTDGPSTSGSVSSSSVGASSVNSNHYHAYSTALANHSNLIDTPENNFMTLSDINKQSSASLQQGGLRAILTGGGNSARVGSTFAVNSGKWYWEVRQSDSTRFFTGVFDVENYVFANEDGGTDAYEWGYITDDNAGAGIKRNNNSSTTGFGGTASSGHVIMVALDCDNNAIWFGKQGSWFNTDGSSNSATVLAQIIAGTTTNATFSNVTGNLTPCCVRQTGDNKVDFNFGQDSTFHGNETHASNTDSNGNGEFQYAPPTGFLALCSNNLDDTTLSANQSEQATDYFNTITYTGDGASSRSLTGVGFQPDWIWYKHRSIAYGHVIYDSSRGTGENHLRTDVNITEGQYNDLYGTLTSFDADGITIAKGDDSSDPDAFFNTNSQTVVGWNWKCGGTTPSKTYKVVVVSDSGNKYRFRNSADSSTFAQSAVTLNLQEGGTYTFDQSDSSNSTHPLRFYTASDKSGGEYTTGVTTNGTAGSAGAYTRITIAASAPTLYYQCSSHAGMGGQINTNTTHGSTNFDGSILSVSQESQTAGFSIVTYTGNNDTSGTIGHGLSSAPEVILLFGRTVSNSNMMGATSQGWTKYATFGNVNGYFVSDSTIWNNTAPTTTVFSVGSAANVNDSYNYVAYCFHSIEGYSAIGKTYTGNSSTDGTFVYTGFRPAWILIKRTNGTGNYFMLDNKRIGYNEANYRLVADDTLVEYTGSNSNVLDILSSGFKLKQVSSNYNTGNEYIYMAFAEQPFKFSNAR